MNAVRHEWIDELCARLERIVHGQVAERILEHAVPDRDGAVAVAPVWRWVRPRIDMGRKAHRLDGAPMLMPVRMAWQPAPVVVLTSPTPAAWSMTGLGHYGTGEVTLVPVHQPTPAPTGDRFPTDGTLDVETLDPAGVRARLQELVDDGRQARWDALMSLEHYVNRAVHHAVVSVSWDVSGATAGDQPAWVLDDTGKQTVADRMLLGSDDHRSRVDRLIERCLEPSVFVNVDPLRYVVKDLHRSAEAEVRKAIGDPHIGRKIRAVQRAMPSASLREVIATYREAHPGDHLSTRRAARALTAGPDVMAAFTELADADDVSPSHEDHVVEALSTAHREAS